MLTAMQTVDNGNCGCMKRTKFYLYVTDLPEGFTSVSSWSSLSSGGEYSVITFSRLYP